jgi:hypothetical protein
LKKGLSLDSQISEAKTVSFTQFIQIIPFHSRVSHFTIGKSRAVRKHRSKSLALAQYIDGEEGGKAKSYNTESILLDEVECRIEEDKISDNEMEGKVSKDTRNIYKKQHHCLISLLKTKTDSKSDLKKSSINR